MPGWSDAGKNLRANATADLVTHISLHSSDPGSDGSNEVSEGGYSRLVPNYDSANNGIADLNDTLSFDTPANQTVSHIGLWASSTFLGGFERTSGDAAANAAGEYNVTSAPITAS